MGTSADPSPVDRRGFLLGTGLGLAAGASLTWLGLRGSQPRFTGRSVENPGATNGMPGRYPGRVIEVRHASVVDDQHRINRTAVRNMVERGMVELTGAEHPTEAWRVLFETDDVVGIKVNPVGRKPLARENDRVKGAVAAISNPEVILEVVKGLTSAGVKPRNIILFERYADQFVDAGYDKLLTERGMEGVRWLAAAAQYHDQQVDIGGFDRPRDAFSPELCQHVVGYDPDCFVHMGYAATQHDPKDDRRFRSHASVVVSRLVNKVINLPVLKDHRSAGVTLALKNMSHGMNNNVARSHLSGEGLMGLQRINGTRSGPNQCNTFIPTAVSQLPFKQNMTLHILDGLIGVYEGGPGNWNQSWGTWPHQGLFFATDPVALDHVGWDIIDAKRAEMGWRPVAQMGLQFQSIPEQVAPALAALAAQGEVEVAVLSRLREQIEAGRATEIFDRRQPEHIILAGTMGLGVFDARRIEHRRIEVLG